MLLRMLARPRGALAALAPPSRRCFSVPAALVKELRTQTGAPMMECKRALEAEDNDIANAAEWLRKEGMSAARGKAGRAASEGLVGIVSSASVLSLASWPYRPRLIDSLSCGAQSAAHCRTQPAVRERGSRLRWVCAASVASAAPQTRARLLFRLAHGQGGTTAAMVEVNSETDFVARNEVFQGLVSSAAASILGHETAPNARDVDGLDAVACPSAYKLSHLRPI